MYADPSGRLSDAAALYDLEHATPGSSEHEQAVAHLRSLTSRLRASTLLARVSPGSRSPVTQASTIALLN